MGSPYPPGPQDFCFGMRTMSKMKADVLGTYTRLQEGYGDVVSFRTGPYRLYVFYHPDHVRDILTTHSKSLRRLPRVMKTFAQWNGNSLLIAEGKDWIRQRRLVQTAFHPRRIVAYSDEIAACANELAKKWATDASANGYVDVDIDQAMAKLTLSIICRTMFRTDTEVQHDGASIQEAVQILGDVAFEEMQAPIRFPMWLPTAYNRKKRWAIHCLDRVVRSFIKEGRERGPGDDLLSTLLHAVDEETGESGLDEQGVRDEVVTLMLAGYDTTAAALNWVSYVLASEPDILTRCRQEVQALGGGPLSFHNVSDLPFVQATVQETLRLYPPAITVFLRQTTRPIAIGGWELPKGALVNLSSFVTHRDGRWFPHPLRFDPERFLGSAADSIPTGAYFPFGAGPRVCIGQAFAQTEMALVTATLLRSFTPSLPPGEQAPEMRVTMALRPARPLRIRWTPTK